MGAGTGFAVVCPPIAFGDELVSVANVDCIILRNIFIIIILHYNLPAKLHDRIYGSIKKLLLRPLMHAHAYQCRLATAQTLKT